jgi:hypothetical protein
MYHFSTVLGLGWFRLRCAQHGAGLVEVAAFVGGNYVDGGGEREAEETDKRIGEADCGEVEVGIGAEEILRGGVRGKESGGGVGERCMWRWRRLRTIRRCVGHCIAWALRELRLWNALTRRWD